MTCHDSCYPGLVVVDGLTGGGRMSQNGFALRFLILARTSSYSNIMGFYVANVPGTSRSTPGSP